MKNNKQLLKIIIPAAIVLIIALGGIIAYKIIRPTPEKTLEKYCNYLANKDYDKAYEMLYNTDNDFMGQEIFKASLENVDFTQYSVKDFNKSDFTYSNIETNGTTYEVQASGNQYAIEVSEVGDRSSMFKNYKINANNLATTWSFSVPKGTQIYINDKQVTNVIGTNTNSDSFDEAYDSGTETYSTNKIFEGNYDVTFKLDGANDISESNVQAGKSVSTDNFTIQQELSDQLQKQAKEFLTAYYNNSDLKDFVSSDSEIIKDRETISSQKLVADTLSGDVTTSNTTIDDSTHAKVKINYSVNTTYTVTSTIHGPVYTDNRNTTMEFKKENDKWVVCTFDTY